MSDDNRIVQLVKEIQMKRDNPMPWPELGVKLAELKALGYGTNKEDKEHWIEKLVKPIDLKRTSAWRFMSLAIKWKDISRYLMQLKLIESDKFEDLDPGISAEQLEILYKIILVSDEETWKPIATKTIKKEITLREIRKHWNHLRPVMLNNSGRTRWSTDLSAMQNAKNQKKNINVIYSATRVYKTVQEQYPEIIKSITQTELFKYSLIMLVPKAYKIGPDEKGKIIEKDILVNGASIIQFNNSDIAVIHGFIIDDGINSNVLVKKIEMSIDLVDFLWVITQQDIQIKNDKMGLIHHDEEKSIILRLKSLLELKKNNISNNELLRIMILHGKEYANKKDEKPTYTLILE